MTRDRRWVLPLIIAGCLPASCGGDNDMAECQAALNWRAESPGAVACRGAPGCACTGGQVCSVTVTDRTTTPWALSASCSALEAARELAFACDGPEDCGAGQVCCATIGDGGGSQCVAERDCSGIGDERVLCRTDEHCTFPGHRCRPADQGSYFDGLVGYCD